METRNLIWITAPVEGRLRQGQDGALLYDISMKRVFFFLFSGTESFCSCGISLFNVNVPGVLVYRLDVSLDNQTVSATVNGTYSPGASHQKRSFSGCDSVFEEPQRNARQPERTEYRKLFCV